MNVHPGVPSGAHQVSMSTPSIGEAGHTGDWRNEYPAVASDACLAVKQSTVTCQICWIHCPDSCITQGIPPTVELDYCKGCGICAEVCPANAIEMLPEAAHGTCELPEGGAR